MFYLSSNDSEHIWYINPNFLILKIRELFLSVLGIEFGTLSNFVRNLIFFDSMITKT